MRLKPNPKSLVMLLILFSVLLFPSMKSQADTNAVGDDDYYVYLPLIRSHNASVPSDTVTGELVNDGIVETAGGVGIGALSNSLTNPISVTVQAVVSPGIQLPPLSQAVGNYYQFSSVEAITPPFDDPFIVAFPVPDGTDPSTLAVAVLQASSEALDVEGSDLAWSVLEGRYDPTQKLLLTTLNSLNPLGRVLVLLSNPTYTSPTNSEAQTMRQVNAPGSVPFSAVCTNFSNAAHCTSTTEATVETELSNIYQRIKVELGYPEPRLRRRIDQISYFPNSYGYFGYTVSIEPYDVGFCNKAAGYYTAIESRLVICYNPAVGFSDYVRDVIVHEYFHATQFAYPQVYSDKMSEVSEGWIIEGMAKSAEKSYLLTEMRRSTSGGWVALHKVDVPINDPGIGSDIEYFAQDFWVYAGKKQTKDFSYLQDILTSGSITWDAANAFGDADHLGLYFDWAKNQAMEAAIDFDGALTSPCSLEVGVVNQIEDFNYDYYNKIFHTVTVAPLNSMVVKINFDHNYTTAYVGGVPENFSQPGANESFKFKVYKDGETGCESVADGNRSLSNVTASGDYYVVISNIDTNESFNYILFIEAEPTPAP